MTTTISHASPDRSGRHLEIVERARKELQAFGPVPSIDELRAALSAIPGNLSDDIIRDRGDY